MSSRKERETHRSVNLTRELAVAAALAGLFGVAAGPAYAKFNIPTDAPPSPMYGAQPFTQKMLMFEEFGPRPMPANPAAHAMPGYGGCDGPSAADAASPTSQWNSQLDTFLSQPIYPLPTVASNTSLPNTWAASVSGCLGRPVTGVIEGRPNGDSFAHQRYSEFLPKMYFQTAMAGARWNGGMRDALQKHQYKVGEFGPGGLYYNTVGPETAATLGVPLSNFNGTTKGIEIRLHPLMPIQDPKALWTFDGTLPPKLLMARYGIPILFRHYNALPINDAANNGFGANTISTHEHNGHNPAESDGYAAAYFYPGEFYDYHWPMILAGHDHINTAATDPRTGIPDGHGGIIQIPGDWHETMSTHWFHDHMLDFTAQNVYKGNAAMMNYYSAIDRGREPKTLAEAQGDPSTPGYGCNYANPNNVNLCLPSGSDMDWGNRSYDVNLLVADKATDQNGQLWFNVFNTDGFLGDIATVNWLYKPYLDVRARRYRFRILNGSVSRYWKIAIVKQVNGTGGQYAGPPGSGISYNLVPYHMIANDGNIMEHAIKFPNAQSPDALPEQGIAERYDIVVDFGKYKPGDRIYFVDTLEHENGKTPKQAIPLAKILSGQYAAAGCPASCDPVVGKFMEIRVRAMKPGQVDLSMNPVDYVPGKKKMIPLPGFTATELANARERTFEFARGGDVKPWTIKTDGGQAFNMDPSRLSAAPDEGGVEIWHIKNGGSGWSHPVHVHYEEGQILQRGGKAPPIWERWARKDVYRIGPLPDSTQSVDLAIRIREFVGTYMEHCHNTQHEDNAMLLRWDSQHPGQVIPLPRPEAGWDGTTYLATNTTDVPTYKTGQGTTFLSNVAAPVAVNDKAGTSPNTAVTVPILDNDSCVGACNPASVLFASGPANGTAISNGDGTVTYTPASGFTGTDSFTYKVSDTTTGAQLSNAATVTVTVQ
jgi:FtsP/CotA-like multicopper oxidase with cupredoxin domain